SHSSLQHRHTSNSPAWRARDTLSCRACQVELSLVGQSVTGSQLMRNSDCDTEKNPIQVARSFGIRCEESMPPVASRETPSLLPHHPTTRCTDLIPSPLW